MSNKLELHKLLLQCLAAVKALKADDARFVCYASTGSL